MSSLYWIRAQGNRGGWALLQYKDSLLRYGDHHHKDKIAWLSHGEVDLTVPCSRKAVKLNHSLTHCPLKQRCHIWHHCVTNVFKSNPWISYNIFILFNSLRPRQSGCHFSDDIFKCIFLNENVPISIKISLKFVPKGPINNIPALVQIMAWRRPGDMPLSEAMMVNLPTHICVSRPQWVNPFGAEARIFQKNNFSTMAADALAPHVVKSKAAMVLISPNKWIPV